MKRVFEKAIVVLIGLISLILTSCSAQEGTRFYSQTGKSNAETYIENKYGFRAEARGSIVRGEQEELISFAFVTMDYNEVSFTVMVDGTRVSPEGKDNYQKDRITEVFLYEIRSLVGAEPADYNLEYGTESVSEYESETGLVSTYFDGTNLKEVFAENSITCAFEYVGNVSFEPLLEYDISGTIFETGSMLFISYPTPEAMSQANAYPYSDSVFKDKDDIYDLAMYIQDAVYISSDETIHYTFN